MSPSPMTFQVGDKIAFTQGNPWTAKDGTKHEQRDTVVAVVTSVTKHAVEYKVLERIATIDTAPFDQGGTVEGGFAIRFADRMGVRKFES